MVGKRGRGPLTAKDKGLAIRRPPRTRFKSWDRSKTNYFLKTARCQMEEEHLWMALAEALPKLKLDAIYMLPPPLSYVLIPVNFPRPIAVKIEDETSGVGPIACLGRNKVSRIIVEACGECDDCFMGRTCVWIGEACKTFKGNLNNPVKQYLF